MVKLVEYPRTATIAWSHDKVPLLATGTASGTVDADFSSTSSLELWSVLAQDTTKPLATITADAKFNDLDWSKDNSVIAGALENGVVEFYSPKEKKSITKVHKHTTGVKTLRFNAKQNNVLVSGGSQGEIFIWDVNKITTQGYSPFGPGNAMTPIDEVQSLAWNQSLAHVFASAGSSGFASIWDLKAMKEVIHLSYTSPNSGLKNQLSVVEWHPNNSTRVATATGNDNEPVILVWDLRNANTPLQVLSQGHSKGIISLDWCLEDEQLMLSSGRDNSCILWNPETAQKLTQYPTRGNWCFKTKFAPAAPELFASASFDNKVEVQTLQNLENKLDLDETAYKQQESETEFWNNVSQTESKEKPIVTKLQAPSWYGNKSPAAQWAFGGKIVQITPDQKGVTIFKPSIEGFEKNSLLNEALQSKDFTPIINKRLAQTIDHTNEEDWNLLETLSMDGKDAYLKESMSLDDVLANENKEDVPEEEFFNNLTQRYTPDGPFNFDLSSKNLVESLMSGNLSRAVKITLDKGLLLESLMIALNSDDDTLKQMVREAYFFKFASTSPLARTLYSISEKRVDDLVDNAAVSQWKYIVRAINTYSAEKDKNDLLTRLGDRLLYAGERQNALVLYLAGHSLDKIAAIWLKELPALESQLVVKKNTLNEAHLECLTEFIERFTVLSSYLNNGTDPKLTNAELIAKFLEFVSFSSSSGDFDLALKFLDTLPADNKQVETEKQRVLIASGRTTTASTVRKPKYGSMPQNVIGSPMAMGGIPPTAQLNDRTYSYNVPSQNVFSPGAPVSSTRPAPYGQNTSSYQAGAVSPPKRYAPAGGSLSNGNGAQHNPAPSLTNPYAPPSGNVFAPSPNAFAPPVTSVAPPTPGASYNQPYPKNQLNQKPISPPLDPSSRIMSGQSPHLNRGANNGWNDLPEIIKEKKVRAKAVSTAPINSPATPGYQATSGNGNAMVPPPPPLSRVTSNTSVSNMPPPLPSSKTPQAPPMNPPSALSSQAYPTPPANPYAVPARTTSYTAPSNPYAPPPSSIPANSPPMYAGQATVAPPSNYVQSTPPALAQQKPISGPPPKTMSRKSNVGTKDVRAANEFLHSIQKMPPSSATTPQQALHSSATTPPKAPHVSQAHQEGSVPPLSKQHEATPGETVVMPAEYQAIADFLAQELARVTPLVPAEFSKQLKDCSKRLNILHAHLEKQDLLTPPTISKLQNLVTLLKEHRYADALAVHVDLATNHAQEAGNWLTGVKRLIGLAEATSN